MLKPFLRWAGGKRRLVPFLLNSVPSDVNRGIYWEPFLGAGSLFFALRPRRAVISDRNAQLIACFRAVRDHPDLVLKYVRMHAARTSDDYYKKIRLRYNKSRDSIAKAAMFIYLNKTCFNGIWRVNRKGEFNVPYGFKEPPAIPSKNDLLVASIALKNAEIRAEDFRGVLTGAQSGDFVYLDPPYPPLNGTSYFTHYTKDRFCDDDQEAVVRMASLLANRGCRVMISQARTPRIVKSFNNWHIEVLSVVRWITCKSKRHRVEEVVITNY